MNSSPLTSNAPSLSPEQLKDKILEILEEGQADQITTIHLKDKTSIADYLIIASGRSTRHVGALAQNLHDAIKPILHHAPTMEGLNQCDWVLVDIGDVIVHLFRPEIRSFYDLESIWA